MRILVVGPSWVGDMVMAQSLFLSLKRAYPNCSIDVLAPLWSLPLLERMPQVAKAVVMPLKHGQFGFFERFKLGRQLRIEGYQQAIVLPNSWKSALVPFFARIPKRTGFVGELRWGLLNDLHTLEKNRLKMTVQRFVVLGLAKNEQELPVYQRPSLPTDKNCQNAVIGKFGLSLASKILVMCPGAEYGPSKRWPLEYFAKVAQVKIGQGWQVWLLGAEKDNAMGLSIREQTQNQVHDFIGQTSLIEAIDLLSLADVVVANDSGLMHLAAALDKKVIAIYGSTSPELAPPLCEKAQVISLNLDCKPCRKRVCPLYPVGHQHHTGCLTGIEPERVLALINP